MKRNLGQSPWKPLLDMGKLKPSKSPAKSRDNEYDSSNYILYRVHPTIWSSHIRKETVPSLHAPCVMLPLPCGWPNFADLPAWKYILKSSSCKSMRIITFSQKAMSTKVFPSETSSKMCRVRSIKPLQRWQLALHGSPVWDGETASLN